jgi:23S rRNA (uracil1939-C5)-methyltransferase
MANSENRLLEVEIERILPGGQGIAHAEGLTIFVALAAPGDRVNVELNRVKGKIAFATIKEILKPSELRVEAPCPYFGRCGGCDFQQLIYQAQLDAKVQIITDCLKRIAKLPFAPDITIERSPAEWRYRSRTSWQVDHEHSRFGYFEGGSHRICDVEFCAVLAPELQQVLEDLRGEMRDGLVTASEIDAVVGDEGVSIAPAGKYETIEVSRKVGNETYRFNARSFFQVNHQLLDRMVAHAIDELTGEFAIDLFSGVGLFTLPLARRFKRVIAVESDVKAVRFARENLTQAGLDNAVAVHSRVSEWLEHNTNLHGEVDLLLLDPPRTGAGPSTIAGILEIGPKQICYVSCDPATLARDLKELIAGGYELDTVKAFDMFPQTHHVETIAHLTRHK